MFPHGFAWGAATSAYQIEGAAATDGRGPSIWDMFCRRPGAVWQRQHGDTACDHYHRYRGDISLMQALGLQAYRFSIAWPRVLPEGRGAVNSAGLDFYDRLVDELLQARITPYATLYHWDYPLALHQQGGWLQPESSDWFARYAATVVDRLSDRVRHWLTLNEPQIFVGKGYQEGCHAPGERLPFAQVLTVGHHVLLAHGKAVQAIRSRARRPAVVGCALAPDRVAVPASEAPQDIQAARQVFLGITRRDCYNTTWWADPLAAGSYPRDGLRLFGEDVPAMGSDDLQVICQPLDFIGLNVYAGERYCAGPDGSPERIAPEPGSPMTSMGWPVVPESVYWATRFVSERYGLPILICENGMANPDWVSLDGAVHDAQRIDFLHRYLRELHRACAEGLAVQAYFLWSLLDNFEWAAGYGQRFGIVYVDFASQRRVLKDSARWYQALIATNGAKL